MKQCRQCQYTDWYLQYRLEVWQTGPRRDARAHEHHSDVFNMFHCLYPNDFNDSGDFIVDP